MKEWTPVEIFKAVYSGDDKDLPKSFVDSAEVERWKDVAAGNVCVYCWDKDVLKDKASELTRLNAENQRLRDLIKEAERLLLGVAMQKNIKAWEFGEWCKKVEALK